ncbi:Domain of unknown function DUF1848 [Chlorobium limicola DSM 245]|uniref:DUF1848 domain-containing protein n=1 Tax=Chlorobium limicola (strain DSM 245 / NBRC 103803 / 6330) TaxID=290315 RepID=B3ECG9_CHLL2|nr:DUF1848 domain-containing protein [Chlorobium limicola]ACD90244.1 Domain of unknown function DUF1848 [Chlorobium limicola DSM 245]
MIVSASRRTDIPAFYGQWMLNRLKAGEVLVRNPMQSKQVSRIILLPEHVDALVFWTKNPEPFLALLPEIDAMGYSSYFLFTLTPYDFRLEPGVPRREARIEVFRKLSSLAGRGRVVWRYDPVILTETMNAAWHASSFALLAEALEGYTERCIISFLDDYRKIRNRMRDIGYFIPGVDEMEELAVRFSGTAGKHGIGLYTCGHDIDLSHCGIMHSHCVDNELIGRICGRKLIGIRKDRGQRKACGCAESRDIGSYDTCMHGCRYCYAVSNRAASRNAALYDPLSPMLCDSIRDDDLVACVPVQKRVAADLFLL